MKLVIAEKSSVAQSIACVIGAAGRKVPDRTLFRLYHYHGLFRLYAELRQHPGTHGLAEGSERQIRLQGKPGDLGLRQGYHTVHLCLSF